MKLLSYFVIGAIAAVSAAWLRGFLNQFLPPPKRAWLALKNLLRDNPPRPENSFRIVLCWLENDLSGDDTKTVERAFTSIEGIMLVRSARLVAASGARDEWRPAMQKSALPVLRDWNGDLAILGLVKKSGQALSLWFVPRSGEGTLGRGDQAYQLEDVTLGVDFHDDLHAQLTAVALTAVAPLTDTEVRGRVLEKGLQDATEKLSNLLDSSAIGGTQHRAALLVALGAALQSLGERDGGTERLDQAVAAYRAALDEFSREHMPLQWATTQNNLGVALQALGARESGTARLELAVAAYRAALEERSREHVPFQWATTQNNLGNALQALGARESGTERLDQAMTAYRAALDELTRERVPLDWAMTQNNLGNALQTLGARESGTERCEQAVTAYRAALEERTRERMPLQWAMTQSNLGDALGILGEREGDTERLELTVTAYRAALEELTGERVPLDWAKTQNNLDRVLRKLHEQALPPV